MITIRSQDKKMILKCHQVTIDFDGKGIIANYKLIGNKESYEKLGNYETKERTMEVMNEIEEHIIDLNNRKYWTYKYPRKPPMNIIFTMPED